jgi:hypothetical protein
MYLNIPINLFIIRGVGIGKVFTLKLIFQGLLQLYNKNLSLDLIKVKALLMAFTTKVAFKIDNQTIHSTWNKH